MANKHSENHFPWAHIIGYVLSIVLTGVALWVGYAEGISKGPFLAIVFTLAFIQAILQLLMFMHMNEGKSGIYQTITMIFSGFVAVVIVAGSVWVMLIGVHVHH